MRGMETYGNYPTVAVAVDKEKSSQVALKWTLENLVSKGQSIFLIHVKTNKPPVPNISTEAYAKELFLPFRCFCTRKEVQCKDVLLEEADVGKAIIEFASQNTIEKIVVGAATKGGFVRRFKAADVPTVVSKGAPDFCTVFVISKGKVSSVKNAVRQVPMISRPPLAYNQTTTNKSNSAIPPLPVPKGVSYKSDPQPPLRPLFDEDTIKSPFTRSRGVAAKSYGEISLPETDISFVSSGRPSTDRMFPSLFDDVEGHRLSRASNSSDSFDSSYDIIRTPMRFIDVQSSTGGEQPSFSHDSTSSWSSQTVDDVEAEMRRLKLELQQTMDMYSQACKEAITAKQKANDLHHWKMEKEQRLEEAKLSEESAMAIVERERAKCKAAIEAAETAQRIAEFETQKRINAEKKALKEAEERKKALNVFPQSNLRYRRYTIEDIEEATGNFSEKRKIGEGGYGPVFRGYLDHTPVAIKVLRPDAAQGRSQFQQEIEVLSCMRHPNMVLLLGACPEYGCLVYEFMANGSLEDCLLRRGNTPAIPWQTRFCIAAEIATGLLFLHQAKPEPLVHRDLKPANILLDRNYVSKISDVGLARLVPPNVAEDVTQYRMTSAAGTFCYIDPEYQQTGMLGIKSDIYSLGILLLQLITAKPAMGLSHHVGHAIEKGTFSEMLDPAVKDWPIEEALGFAKLSLSCAELRRKDRPDLGKVVLPELERLRALAEDNMYHRRTIGDNTGPSPMYSHASIISQETLSDIHNSETESSRSRSSISSWNKGKHSLDW